jgi:hypothetical protein
MMMVRSNAETEAGALPDKEGLARMVAYNDELVKAGALLALEGLQPSSSGARVTFDGGRTAVTDGPFAEAKELIAGFWLIQAKSLDEAIQWARRVPLEDGQIEIRRVFEGDDLGDAYTPEIREKEEQQRAAMALAA